MGKSPSSHIRRFFVLSGDFFELYANMSQNVDNIGQNRTKSPLARRLWTFTCSTRHTVKKRDFGGGNVKYFLCKKRSTTLYKICFDWGNPLPHIRIPKENRVCACWSKSTWATRWDIWVISIESLLFWKSKACMTKLREIFEWFSSNTCCFATRMVAWWACSNSSWQTTWSFWVIFVVFSNLKVFCLYGNHVGLLF